MNFRPTAAALAIVALLACSAAEAADFSVTPVRIFMTPRDRAIAVTVVNEGNEEVVMQAELFAWRQKSGGDDELTATEDLVLSPPIMKLAPQSRQVVRLARVGATPTGKELYYRMIVREVPEAKPQGKEAKVTLALAFSMPVFVTPPGAKRKLDCSMARSAPDTVRVSCANSGTAYAQIRAMNLLGAGGAKIATRDAGGYLLPETQREFELKAPARIPGGKVVLQAAMDDGSTQNFDGTLSD